MFSGRFQKDVRVASSEADTRAIVPRESLPMIECPWLRGYTASLADWKQGSPCSNDGVWQSAGMVKRAADWLEKFSVAATSCGLFQEEALDLVIGLVCIIASIYLTRRSGYSTQ
jgi:hypothetical protein